MRGELDAVSNVGIASVDNVHFAGDAWAVRQTLLDPEGNNDWVITAVVDFAASAEEGRVVLQLASVARIGD